MSGVKSTPKTSRADKKADKKRGASSPLEGIGPKKVVVSSGIESSSVPEIPEVVDEQARDLVAASIGTTAAGSGVPSGSSTAPSIVLDDDHLKAIAVNLRESFTRDLADSLAVIVEPIVEGVLAGLRAQVNDLQRENTALRETNSVLLDRVEKLEMRADEAEQYSRRNSLRISGLPESSGEDTDTLVIELGTELGVPLTRESIDRSHRVGRKDVGSGPRQVLVKFATYRSRSSLFRARFDLNKNRKYKRVFINEDLTKQRSSLLFQARQKVRNSLVKKAWSSDGRVLVKDNSDKTVSIYRQSDLDAL